VPVVVDSSVAACWALPDEFSEIANRTLDRLALDAMLVPPIFWYEIRNVLLVNERRQRILMRQGQIALEKMADIPTSEDDGASSDDVMSLARTHGLTVYDAAYLELAKRRGATLATLDGKLASAATREGIAVIA
jgi:predicted nucleic acid-binding protein